MVFPHLSFIVESTINIKERSVISKHETLLNLLHYQKCGHGKIFAF